MAEEDVRTTAAEPCVDTCIAHDSAGNICLHRVAFIVAGDNACHFHLVQIVRQRVIETHKPSVEVEVVP